MWLMGSKSLLELSDEKDENKVPVAEVDQLLRIIFMNIQLWSFAPSRL